jgi:hypothetical protein
MELHANRTNGVSKSAKAAIGLNEMSMAPEKPANLAP